jgi:capsular exopolysaccharide synthesis family protein
MRIHSRDKQASHTKQFTTTIPSALAPYCQALVNRLALGSGAVETPHTLGVTSCARRAGVSTIASGLAELVAGGGQRVLLIDAHWQHPAQARRFGIGPAPGLWDLLVGDATANEAIARTAFENLCLLPSGGLASESLWLSSRGLLADLLTQWQERFDLIVLDFPPALLEEPTIAWTGLLDGVLLVVEAEQTEAAEANRAKQALIDCEARLLGAVLNKRRSYLPRWFRR